MNKDKIKNLNFKDYTIKNQAIIKNQLRKSWNALWPYSTNPKSIEKVKQQVIEQIVISETGAFLPHLEERKELFIKEIEILIKNIDNMKKKKKKKSNNPK